MLNKLLVTSKTHHFDKDFIGPFVVLLHQETPKSHSFGKNWEGTKVVEGQNCVSIEHETICKLCKVFEVFSDGR